MELIVGGAHQGKLQYLLRATGLTPDQVTDREPVEGYLVIDHLQEILRERMRCGQSTQELLEALADREVYLLCDEVGCGVTPVETDQLRWREEVGRACQFLATRATRVERVFCGIPLLLKGEPR